MGLRKEPKDHFMRSESKHQKRKYPRFQSKQLFRFMRENGDEIKSISKIINVSQGGLQFACRDKMEINTVLRMDVPSPEGRVNVVLEGRVVWINSSPDSNGLYYSGMSFENLKEDVRALVLKAMT
jgi:hypothetical protein